VHLEMGLLRLINAKRLAPMEEILAELRSGAAVGTTSSSAARSSNAATAATAGAPKAPAMPGFSAAPQTSSHLYQRSAASGFAAAAAASAPARAEAQIAPSTEPPTAATAALVAETPIEKDPETRVDGITKEQVAEIKAAIQAQQKFLGEIVQQGSRWELDGAELRIYFAPEKRAFAEMMEGRESLEKVRASSSKVLGRPVRVCAKVEAVAEAAPRGASGTEELRAQFERDPMVRSMLQRFGGRISEVKWRQEES